MVCLESIMNFGTWSHVKFGAEGLSRWTLTLQYLNMLFSKGLTSDYFFCRWVVKGYLLGWHPKRLGNLSLVRCFCLSMVHLLVFTRKITWMPYTVWICWFLAFWYQLVFMALITILHNGIVFCLLLTKCLFFHKP